MEVGRSGAWRQIGLLGDAQSAEHPSVHRPQTPTAWIAVAAFFVVLAGGVIMLASVVSGESAIGWGSGLVAVGGLMGAVAVFRLQTRGEHRPRR